MPPMRIKDGRKGICWAWQWLPFSLSVYYHLASIGDNFSKPTKSSRLSSFFSIENFHTIPFHFRFCSEWNSTFTIIFDGIVDQLSHDTNNKSTFLFQYFINFLILLILTFLFNIFQRRQILNLAFFLLSLEKSIVTSSEYLTLTVSSKIPPRTRAQKERYSNERRLFPSREIFSAIVANFVSRSTHTCIYIYVYVYGKGRRTIERKKLAWSSREALPGCRN